MDDPSARVGTLATLVALMGVSVWLGMKAEQRVRKGPFLQGYFLGHRGLGTWALALTATVQSGGTFMGFPSLVYSHGWVVALWIASYMVVPITAFGVLGKRLAQLSRRTGAITVPDLLRERFASPSLGLVTSLLIIFYMLFMMVAQFKAGALIMKICWPGTDLSAAGQSAGSQLDLAYYLGLVIFTVTVVGYTLIGGFLAAVWTDLLQSLLMLVGVLILLPLAVSAAGGLESASRLAADQTGPEFLFGPGYAPDGRQFHPLGLAVSYFFVWVFAGLGSPSSMVRVMACRNTETIRRSIVLLTVYNALIYLPLVVICVSARAVLPPLSASDEVIPRIALQTTSGLAGGSLLAGLILAAPFGAVMATVSAYLVVIASGLVRDVYQRFVRPGATAAQLRRRAYLVMVAVGGLAFAANIRPVTYLQAIVVFSGTGGAATFVAPALMAVFWRRATAAGAMAAMCAGSATVLGLFVAGWTLSWQGIDPMIGPATGFRPYYLLSLEPIVWGLLASAVAGVVVSLLSRVPDQTLVSRFFDAEPQRPRPHFSPAGGGEDVARIQA